MKDFTTLLALPATLLSIIAIPTVQAEISQSPRERRHDIEQQIKRDAELGEKLAHQKPLGVRKMSDDHSQKFFLDYWTFDDLDKGSEQRRPFGRAEHWRLYHNASDHAPMLKPIAPHTNHDRQRRSLFGRNIFARDYDCPSNTNSCDSIGYENACCPAGEDCISTSGGVGCCPSGQDCGDDVSGCDASLGYTECSTDSSSGCCIPGASCESGGCVFYGTQIVTTTLPLETDTSGVSIAVETSSGREVTVVYTDLSVSAYTTTETVTATPSGYTTTRTVNPEETDDTAVAGAPILPTSETSDEPVSAATTVTTTSLPPDTTYATDSCPTGFYMCQARYLGGCCRVDRNCDTTSCPAGDTTTIIEGSSRTVVATSTAGSCANGWFLCGPGEGGGCCPNGYDCGSNTCNAVAAGQEDTQKQAPSQGTVMRVRWALAITAVGAGLGIVLL